MVKLIDASYFTKGERQILGCDTSLNNPQGSKAVVASVEGYIVTIQTDYLQKMLGIELADVFQSALDNNTLAEDDVLNAFAPILRESFAEYTFYRIFRTNQDAPTIDGVVEVQSANTHKSPYKVTALAYNRMVEHNRMFGYMASRQDKYDVRICEEMLTPLNLFGI